MIIVEGPDGAGKTTLVRKLANELGLQVGQRATANRDELYKVTRQDTYTALAAAISGKDPVRVWDRLFFSELIYADVVGRPIEFSPGEQHTVRATLAALGVPVILCYPPMRVVIENVASQHQMAGVAENIKRIYQSYSGVIGLHPFLMWHDYTEQSASPGYMTYDQLIERCQHYLEVRAERMWA